MEDKTEFLFESDAEKAVLNEASKPKKKKLYKKIIINSIVISLVLTGSFFGLGYYENAELFKLSASVISSKNTIQTVNEKLNKSSNNLKTISNNNSKYEIIVNQANPIDEDLVNNYTIVNVENNSFNNIKLEEKTYNNYLKLKSNLEERGYYINIRSGFRSFKDSERIYNSYANEKGNNYAEKYVAKAGTSEHNIGLSFDFVLSNNKNAANTNYDSDEYFYLENIAYLYGFIIRYPKDKENITGYSYEPWHLRYVGNDLAKYLKKSNLTLEEYYEN